MPQTTMKKTYIPPTTIALPLSSDKSLLAGSMEIFSSGAKQNDDDTYGLSRSFSSHNLWEDDEDDEI